MSQIQVVINVLAILSMFVNAYLFYRICRLEVEVSTPSASHNSVSDAILLADEYHITTRSYSKEEAAIAGFKRWLRAKRHP